MNFVTKTIMKPQISYRLRVVSHDFDCNTEEINEIIRNTADSAYHPSCTNKMGKDKMSVVDEDTKVHGINNLRIIDSSIMPDIVSGNINAATLMIAEKGSDLILQKEEQPIRVP